MAFNIVMKGKSCVLVDKHRDPDEKVKEKYLLGLGTMKQTETDNGFKMFIKKMKLKLNLNQEEKGDSWVTCDIAFLEGKLFEEIEEYLAEKKHGRKSEELVDIANICMMLSNRHFLMWAEGAAL